MVKDCNFNNEIFYVGVNAGTLGFAQDISVDEIGDFVANLSRGEYTYEEIGVQEVLIVTNNSKKKMFSLNKLLIIN